MIWLEIHGMKHRFTEENPDIVNFTQIQTRNNCKDEIGIEKVLFDRSLSKAPIFLSLEMYQTTYVSIIIMLKKSTRAIEGNFNIVR